MAVPRTPVTIDTSDTFSTWLTNTNYAVDILKNVITDTVLTHSSGAYTLGETVSQSATSSTGIVRVAGATTTTVVTTAGAFTTGSAVVGATSSVSKTPSAVSASHLATTDAALTTPTITAPVIATITNNSNTLTLPTSADTLVGRATTDTLTNKTLTSPTINGGTITSVTLTSPTLGTVANLTIANAGNIGSVGDTDAMAISSGGVVTFSQRDVHTLGITVADGQTIGSATDADAITIASAGAVTFSQRDVHTLGITVADAGQIGSASDLDAIAIGADGDITLTQDLELQHDGATISLGEHDDVTITHVADDGLIIRTVTGGFTKLQLHASDTDVADGNLLGEISFVAPVEGAGSDAILPAAAIAARSEGDFSATNNATELVFNTGASEDASIGATGGKMILSSAGNLSLTAGGLQFPATFSNETDANTLDDYEEGTFTPTFANITADTAEGRYTKIGRMVYATVLYDYNGGDNFNNFVGQALPFTVIDEEACGFVTMSTTESYNYDDGYDPQFFYLNQNAATWGGFTESGLTVEYTGRAKEVARANKVRFGFVYETAS